MSLSSSVWSQSPALIPLAAPQPWPVLESVRGMSPTDADATIDFRQLRHHTKNALQRIIGLIAQSPGLHATPEGERIAQELEQRICLSATISNALFGLTRAPGDMAKRLRDLSSSVLELLRDADQAIELDVSVLGECPPRLRETVLRVAHELLGNAIKHGMRDRPTGRIEVRLETTAAGHTRLSVIDDGCGLGATPGSGEGLHLAQDFADQHGGTLWLWSDGRTTAMVDLPPAAAVRRRTAGGGRAAARV